MVKSTTSKPIIRWVGGKTKLLPEIQQRLPETYKTYIEPFVGGGAVVFNLLPSQAIVADKNNELINFYNQLKVDWKGVCDAAKSFKNDEASYYEIRAWDREPTFHQENAVKRAARFLFLSKTSFQGLWRVNIKKGYHNTPYGRPKNYEIDFQTFKEFAERIQGISFTTDDFENVMKSASEGDFVYLDPPYIPISDTASFTAYTLGGFTDEDQIRLRDCCKSLNARGAKFLLSNSDCGRTRELYSEFIIDTIIAKRLVSAKSTSRGNITEVLVKNYEKETK